MNCFLRVNCVKDISSVLFNNNIQACYYAARKGTRAKALKKKVKVEIKKVGFIPHNLREGNKGPIISKRMSDEHRQMPVDDVYIQRFYKWKIYDFKEAVESHRETHHPHMYNMPNAPLHAFIELDMNAAKKNKYVHSFNRNASTPHTFYQGEDRSVLVFCKTSELQEEARNAGATQVADVDIIKKIEKGDIVLPDFEHILAHPNILPELVSIRSTMKKRFPNMKSGTLGANIGELVTSFKSGIKYTALQDIMEPSYGYVDACIGPLDMETKHLEDNLKALLKDIEVMKPKRTGPFITRAFLKCKPSTERFIVNLQPYIGEELTKDDYESDSDDEAVTAVNS